jgi:hypothetical protein
VLLEKRREMIIISSRMASLASGRANACEVRAAAQGEVWPRLHGGALTQVHARHGELRARMVAGCKAFTRTRRRLAKRRLPIAGDPLCGAQRGARRGVRGDVTGLWQALRDPRLAQGLCLGKLNA